MFLLKHSWSDGNLSSIVFKSSRDKVWNMLVLVVFTEQVLFKLEYKATSPNTSPSYKLEIGFRWISRFCCKLFVMTYGTAFFICFNKYLELIIWPCSWFVMMFVYFFYKKFISARLIVHDSLFFYSSWSISVSLGLSISVSDWIACYYIMNTLGFLSFSLQFLSL